MQRFLNIGAADSLLFHLLWSRCFPAHSNSWLKTHGLLHQLVSVTSCVFFKVCSALPWQIYWITFTPSWRLGERKEIGQNYSFRKLHFTVGKFHLIARGPCIQAGPFPCRLGTYLVVIAVSLSQCDTGIDSVLCFNTSLWKSIMLDYFPI